MCVMMMWMMRMMWMMMSEVLCVCLRRMCVSDVCVGC